MLRWANNLFDSVRKWKYVETTYDPKQCFAQDWPTSGQKELYDNLEKIYEWNYDNLRGSWNHITKEVSKGRLCRAAKKHFFTFKRKEDAVAFKLQWGE